MSRTLGRRYPLIQFFIIKSSHDYPKAPLILAELNLVLRSYLLTSLSYHVNVISHFEMCIAFSSLY